MSDTNAGSRPYIVCSPVAAGWPHNHHSAPAHLPFIQTQTPSGPPPDGVCGYPGAHPQADETGNRWGFGEVIAEPDEDVATHLHPGEAEAFIILEGQVELHGADGVVELRPGDVVFIPPDTEHGLRTPNGGRWLAVWPTRERIPGLRYAR